MQLATTMICWDWQAKTVKVGPHPDRTGWSRNLASDGACWMHWKGPEPIMRVALLMAMFHALILRDGFSPQTIHDEFLKIKEYRQFIAPDVKGAEAD